MQYNFVFLHLVIRVQKMRDITPSNIQTFMELVTAARKPVVVTHAKPDGDAIGSSVAMYHFLKMLKNGECHIVLNDDCPRFLKFVRDTVAEEDIIVMQNDSAAARKTISDSDLIICLDFHAFYRTRDLEEPITRSEADKVLIDHHLDPDRSLYKVSFSKNDISSASELLFWILMATPNIGNDARKLPPACSLALMTGMTTDTNNFGNSVYPSTLMMASALLEAGVDRDLILQKINQEHSEDRLRLKGFMLKDLMRVTEDGVAYMILDKASQLEYRMQEGDTEGFVNEPLSISGVKMSIYAREESDEIRISIRSKKGTSANRCAKMFFDGGGHENAAGGKLMIPVADVEDYIRRYSHIYMTEYEK